MSPDLILPAQSEQQLNKMSVAQLEQFVSFIVKRSCGNGANPDNVGTKPKWWPRDLAFSYPIARSRSMDPAKWRETLLDVVARCYTYRNRSNFGHNDNATARKIRSAARQNGRRRPDEKITACYENPTDNAVVSVNSQPADVNNIRPAELSPVVSLCDVLKLQSKDKSFDSDSVSKNDFLNYFKLSDTQNCSVILNNNVYKPPSHPIHLINSQQVPFSSDLGKKMTKECHIVPLETHQRKIERVERYLTTVINTDTAKPVEYEISFNKLPQYSHTYVFPNKIFRRKERLSSKASFLLMHHCRPCIVKLENLKIPPPKPVNNKLVQTKENVPIDLQKEIVNQRTNFHHETLIEQFSTTKENAPTPAPPKLFTKTLVNSIRSNKKENMVLKTLVPQNENSLLKNSFNPKPVNKNILNASVLLTPINGFFGLQSSKSTNSKSTKKKKASPIRREKMNRVQKRRVLIYHPRRFSLRVLRLKYITNNKS